MDEYIIDAVHTVDFIITRYLDVVFSNFQKRHFLVLLCCGTRNILIRRSEAMLSRPFIPTPDKETTWRTCFRLYLYVVIRWYRPYPGTKRSRQKPTPSFSCFHGSASNATYGSRIRYSSFPYRDRLLLHTLIACPKHLEAVRLSHRRSLMYEAGAEGDCKLCLKRSRNKDCGRLVVIFKTSGAGFRKSRCGMEDCRTCGMFNCKFPHVLLFQCLRVLSKVSEPPNADQL